MRLHRNTQILKLLQRVGHGDVVETTDQMIAKITGLNIRTVKRGIQDLKQKGLIETLRWRKKLGAGWANHRQIVYKETPCNIKK